MGGTRVSNICYYIVTPMNRKKKISPGGKSCLALREVRGSKIETIEIRARSGRDGDVV